MLLLPYTKFTLITKLQPPHIVTRLEANVETGPRSFRKMFFPAKPYFGSFSEQGFRIRRTGQSRNTTPIVITGVIISDFADRRIDVSMEITKLGLAAHIFSLIVFAFMGVLVLAVYRFEWYGVLIIPAGMWLLTYIPMIISFHLQVRKAKKILGQMLDADIYIDR